MRRNLIIVPLGEGNVVHTWFDRAAERQFDLCAIDFRAGEQGRPPHAEYFWRRPGFKFEHLYFLTNTFAETLRRYDAIWCPDDDVALDTQSINRMFALFGEYRLQLAQPAIARGEVTYAALRPQRGAVLRYTPFVEVMCPVLTPSALFRVRHLFPENRSGWGIDWAWSCLFRAEEMAVLDCIGAHHTRPLATGEHYVKLKQLGIDPGQDLKTWAERFGSVPKRVMRRMTRGDIRLPTVYENPPVEAPWQRMWKRVLGRAA